MTTFKPEDFTVDLAALRDDVAKLTSSVSEFIRSQGEFIRSQSAAATNTVFDAADSARQKISDTASKAQDRVVGASAELEKTIEHNPLVAVFLATLSGMLVGLLMGMLSPTRK